jgi:hypothetical protein
MKDVAAADTRNFALVGHSTDGKTSLGEAILWKAGAIAALGNVTAGAAALTTLPEEKERQGASVSTAVYGFDWQGRHLTVIDTPGDPNFQSDGQIALQALDAAVLVVSAVDGAKVGTDACGRNLGLPMLAFVNGMTAGGDFDTASRRSPRWMRPVVPRSRSEAAQASAASSTCSPCGAADAARGRSRTRRERAEAQRTSSKPSPNATTRCSKVSRGGELSRTKCETLAGARPKLVPIFAGGDTRLGIETRAGGATAPSPSTRARTRGDGHARRNRRPFAASCSRPCRSLPAYSRCSASCRDDPPGHLIDATKARSALGNRLLRGHDHVEVRRNPATWWRSPG